VDDSEEGEDEVVREVGAVGLELGVEVSNSISKVLWMATLSPTSLPSKLILPQSSNPPLLQPKTASKL
jgi:hypothetical protein